MVSKLGGRYQLLEDLGGHPPVRIFRAVDTVSGEPVLMKTMPVSGDDMEAFIRFQEEAALITSIDHPNFVKVYGTFIDEGVSCIILESVHGPSLGEILRAEHLPLGRIKRIALQIAGALAYGHDRNLIHRDLEPENILMLPGDTVKIRAVMEMGTGRLVRGAAMPIPTSGPRAELYASPEQRKGQTVGPRTDLYSLGALMYHMVTGHPPFDDTVYSGGVQFSGDVPDEWQALIARAMARSEKYRFADAREMGEALARLPAPGAPPMEFQAPPKILRCPKCGREARGRFCSGCGTPIGQ